MKELICLDDVRDRIISLRKERVILDSDVAALYGVETKRINEAVKNNPDKFPRGYIIELKPTELYGIRSKFSTANASLQKTTVLPKAFTEKGLYMLATILKSPQAVQTTIAIVEAFADIRELSRAVAELAEGPEEERQKSLMQRSGEIIGDLIGNELKTTDTDPETERPRMVKSKQPLKHTVKRKQE